MTHAPHLESHHGVLVQINGQGVLILGEPGIGKSSLALELLYQGHKLIADDIVEFESEGQHVTGHCPTLLSKLLHTRELGLISVIEAFGKKAWQPNAQLDHIIMLHQNTASKTAHGLAPELDEYTICQQTFTMLKLSTNNPASLPHRIDTWLRLQPHRHNVIQRFNQQQNRTE